MSMTMESGRADSLSNTEMVCDGAVFQQFEIVFGQTADGSAVIVGDGDEDIHQLDVNFDGGVGILTQRRRLSYRQPATSWPEGATGPGWLGHLRGANRDEQQREKEEAVACLKDGARGWSFRCGLP